MALELTEAAVSPLDPRPQYHQLADAIRQKITTGEVRRGEVLPTEAVLAAKAGVSRTTLREAIDVLVGEGLVVKRAGLPSRVSTPPPVRHMATSRYADELALLRHLPDGEDHPLSSAFTADHCIEWTAYRVEPAYSEDAASDAEADRLGLAPGTPVLRRQLVKYADGMPVQLQESVMPLARVKDTPVADPSRQPWPGGTIAELYSVGLVVARVREEVRARTPTTAERTSLQMEGAGPVFEIIRVFSTDDAAVEASLVVCSAAGTVLAYDTDLQEEK